MPREGAFHHLIIVSYPRQDKRSKGNGCAIQHDFMLHTVRTATAGSDVVQSGRPVFDDFFQHLWPHIGNNKANVVFQMVKRLWLIRIDQ
ncbi:hypothetical protein TNCV_1506441 [Trichonephila clavipes]|nr:hypothetical protein TNCV_1506441 [Trichonephila clavipes]